jgi:hypothetical protein
MELSEIAILVGIAVACVFVWTILIRKGAVG